MQVENVDILRDPDGHNLLNPALKIKFLELISSGGYDFVVCAPPCNTLSRALLHDEFGPARLRDRDHPWVLQVLKAG